MLSQRNAISIELFTRGITFIFEKLYIFYFASNLVKKTSSISWYGSLWPYYLPVYVSWKRTIKSYFSNIWFTLIFLCNGLDIQWIVEFYISQIHISYFLEYYARPSLISNISMYTNYSSREYTIHPWNYQTWDLEVIL